MSKKEDREKEKTHAKKAEDDNFECHVIDIDLLFNTSFIFLHHLALRYLIFRKVRFSTFGS